MGRKRRQKIPPPATPTQPASTLSPGPTQGDRVGKRSGWLLTAVGSIGIAGGFGIASFFQGYLRNRTDDIHRQEDERRRIAALMVAPLVQPAPSENGHAAAWDTVLIVRNEGPAVAKHFILQVALPDPTGMKYGKARILIPPPGAEIEVPDTSPGLVQVVARGLLPSTGFWVSWRAEPSASKRDLLLAKWRHGMFERAFTAEFVSRVDVSGEDLTVGRDSMYEIPVNYLGGVAK